MAINGRRASGVIEKMEALIFVGLSIMLLIGYFVVAASMGKEKADKKTTSDILNEMRRRHGVLVTMYEALPGKIMILDAPRHQFWYINTSRPQLSHELINLRSLKSATVEKSSTLDQGVTVINEVWLHLSLDQAESKELKILFYDRKANSPIEGPLHYQIAKKWIKQLEKIRESSIQYA